MAACLMTEPSKPFLNSPLHPRQREAEEVALSTMMLARGGPLVVVLGACVVVMEMSSRLAWAALLDRLC